MLRAAAQRSRSEARHPAHDAQARRPGAGIPSALHRAERRERSAIRGALPAPPSRAREGSRGPRADLSAFPRHSSTRRGGLRERHASDTRARHTVAPKSRQGRDSGRGQGGKIVTRREPARKWEAGGWGIEETRPLKPEEHVPHTLSGRPGLLQGYGPQPRTILPHTVAQPSAGPRVDVPLVSTGACWTTTAVPFVNPAAGPATATPS